MINSPKKLSCEYTNVKVINFIYNIFINYDLLLYQNINVYVGSQIVAHTLTETGNGPNRPNTIDLWEWVKELG